MNEIKYPWYASTWFIVLGFVVSVCTLGLSILLPIVSIFARKYEKKRAGLQSVQDNIVSLQEMEQSIQVKIQEAEQTLQNKHALFERERQMYITSVENEIKQANQQTISQAQQQASQIVSQAQQEANRITTNAPAEAQRIIQEATIEAERIKNNAPEEAQRILRNAKAEATAIKNNAEQYANNLKSNSEREVQELLAAITRYSAEKEELVTSNEKMDKQVKTAENRLRKLKVEFEGAKSLIENYPDAISIRSLEQSAQQLIESYDEHSLLKNLIELDCHYKNSKELRKDMNKIKKDIDKLLETYVARYTTKVNKTIYQLMIIGLQAEFQTILYTLTYSKLEEAQENVRDLIRRYLAICADGNQSILSTLTRFLNELEPLFLQGVEVEYRYYVEREKEKEEQREIREQMRQEAAEKKALQEAQKKLEQEEAKYEAEMQRNRELLATTTDSDMLAKLEARIRELEQQHEQIEEKREEILKRANGQAGHVYIISNLGAFGENMFKIGMTRRLDPMERIDELGSASVPFKFDIHAMMFSDNAVALENELHNRLSAQRVNKVNLRKEFFYTNVAELQALVEEIDPTAEFRPTLLAQEFYQSKEVLEV